GLWSGQVLVNLALQDEFDHQFPAQARQGVQRLDASGQQLVEMRRPLLIWHSEFLANQGVLIGRALGARRTLGLFKSPKPAPFPMIQVDLGRMKDPAAAEDAALGSPAGHRKAWRPLLSGFCQ